MLRGSQSTFLFLLSSICLVFPAFASTSVTQKNTESVNFKNETISACNCAYTFKPTPYVGLSSGLVFNVNGPSHFAGFTGTVSLGYGGLWNKRFYLGGEVFAGDVIAQAYNRPDATGGGMGARTTWNYGMSLIPGVVVTHNILGYLRLGVVETQFDEVSVSDTTETGWQVGAGGKTNLSKRVDMRLEYVYSNYGNREQPGFSAAVGQSNAINLGIIYKFHV